VSEWKEDKGRTRPLHASPFFSFKSRQDTTCTLFARRERHRESRPHLCCAREKGGREEKGLRERFVTNRLPSFVKAEDTGVRVGADKGQTDRHADVLHFCFLLLPLAQKHAQRGEEWGGTPSIPPLHPPSRSIDRSVSQSPSFPLLSFLEPTTQRQRKKHRAIDAATERRREERRSAADPVRQAGSLYVSQQVSKTQTRPNPPPRLPHFLFR